MIVTSKVWYLPAMINAIVIAKEDNYFYMDRSVYDEAVILSDRYSLNSLFEIVGVSNNREVSDWFYDNAPKPLNILAPFLGLSEEGLIPTIEECCGALHVITGTLSIRNYINHPIELRKGVTFSLRIKEEYTLAWENFFALSIPFEERNNNRNSNNIASNSNNSDYSGEKEQEFVAQDLGDGKVLLDDSMFDMDIEAFERAMNGEEQADNSEINSSTDLNTENDDYVSDDNGVSEKERIKMMMRKRG